MTKKLGKVLGWLGLVRLGVCLASHRGREGGGRSSDAGPARPPPSVSRARSSSVSSTARWAGVAVRHHVWSPGKSLLTSTSAGRADSRSCLTESECNVAGRGPAPARRLERERQVRETPLPRTWRRTCRILSFSARFALVRTSLRGSCSPGPAGGQGFPTQAPPPAAAAAAASSSRRRKKERRRRSGCSSTAPSLATSSLLVPSLERCCGERASERASSLSARARPYGQYLRLVDAADATHRRHAAAGRRLRGCLRPRGRHRPGRRLLNARRAG